MPKPTSRPLLLLRRLDELRQLLESIGPPCWAAGASAAALCGFDGFELAPPYEVAVPHERCVTRRGHVVRRLRDIDRLDTTWASDLPCLSPTRLLIELAATESPERLTAALDSALRDGGTSEDFLHRRIVELRRRGRPGLRRLLEVIVGAEATRGGHSWLERRFLALLHELRLPLPDTQRVVGRRGNTQIRVDCVFPGTNVVVELLGYQFHRSQMQMQVDAERLNRLQLDGHVAVQFTYTDVVTRSAAMIGVLAEVFDRPELVAGATVKRQKRTSRSVASQRGVRLAGAMWGRGARGTTAGGRGLGWRRGGRRPSPG